MKKKKNSLLTLLCKEGKIRNIVFIQDDFELMFCKEIQKIKLSVDMGKRVGESICSIRNNKPLPVDLRFLFKTLTVMKF